MIIRNAAQSRGKPYFGTLQACDLGFTRMPSESDIRMQAFSYLAAGYDALGYFTYGHIGKGAIMDPEGEPTPLYDIVKKLNPFPATEISNDKRPSAPTGGVDV